ncbi:MAG: hypothetical protein AAGJ83_06600 [Planctomycetota bacterium]
MHDSTPRRLSVTSRWVLAAALWIGCGAVYGQRPPYANKESYANKEESRPPRRSILSKLDAFQNDVRQRMKRALGIKAASPEATNDLSPASTTREASIDSNSLPNASMPKDFNAVRPVRVDSGQQWHRHHTQNTSHQEYYGTGDVTTETSPQVSDPFGNGNSFVGIDPMSGTVRGVQASVPLSEPLPSPIRDSQTQPFSQPMQPRMSPPPSVGGSHFPVANGDFLGQAPITATERALRLIEENADLKAKLAAAEMQADRLREKLLETQSLLTDSSQAVQTAKEEIDLLVDSNRQLQQDLDASETRYNRYLAETDRMLDSIREELDDVLVREISSKRN